MKNISHFDKLSIFARDYLSQDEGLCPRCGYAIIEGKCMCEIDDLLRLGDNLIPVPIEPEDTPIGRGEICA